MGVLASLGENQTYTAPTVRTCSEVHYTREVLLAELEEARKMAIKKDQPSAAVSATIGKARVLGLIIDRRELGDVGAFDGFTDEELIREATRRARELGLGVHPSNKAH